MNNQEKALLEQHHYLHRHAQCLTAKQTVWYLESQDAAIKVHHFYKKIKLLLSIYHCYM